MNSVSFVSQQRGSRWLSAFEIVHNNSCLLELQGVGYLNTNAFSAGPSQGQAVIFVSPELSSVRDYVITHSVCSMCMYVVCSMYVYVCGILQNLSLYPHTLMYYHGTWTQ